PTHGFRKRFAVRERGKFTERRVAPFRHPPRIPVTAASTLARSSSASLLSLVNSSYSPSIFSMKSSSSSSAAAVPV
ncbi:MAG: hypothetical protein ACRDRT_14175, partial [Pseudonocardiaceae bacterium]